VSNFRNAVQSSKYYIKYSWPIDIVVKWQQFMLNLAVSINTNYLPLSPQKREGKDQHGIQL